MVREALRGYRVAYVGLYQSQIHILEACVIIYYL